MKNIDTGIVPHHIDGVHGSGHPHGGTGVAHHPEQRRPRAVKRQEGDRCLHNHIIGIGVGRHVRLHLTEDHVEHEALAQVKEYHYRQGDLRHKQQQLLGGVTGLAHFPPAQILPRDDGASGGQRGKGVDQQHVHRVHQRHGGNGRLSHLGDHQGV